MKKRIFCSLAVALSITAVGAANPFSDVPTNHWAYDSVTKLAKAGIVEGYEDGSYRGDRTMTRYEMAQVIARALATQKTSGGISDGTSKAELDKLSVEFAKELKNLGVRVTALEGGQSDNVKFSGDMRLQYVHGEDGVWAGKNEQEARVRLQAEGKVNENWTVVGRFEGLNDLRTSDDSVSDVTMDKMFAQGDYGKFQTRVGRIDLIPAYGMMYDDYADGAEVSWTSDRFVGTARVLGTLNEETFASSDSYDAYMGEVAFLNVAKGLNLRGQYTHFNGKNLDGGIWEAGFDYAPGEGDWKVTAAVADTTGDIGKGKEEKRSAWFAQLDYKGAEPSEVSSWGAFGGYRDFQNSGAVTGLTTFNTSGKGWYVGGNYTPAKNVVISAWYEKMKPQFTSEGNQSKNYFQGEIEFFF